MSKVAYLHLKSGSQLIRGVGLHSIVSVDVSDPSTGHDMWVAERTCVAWKTTVDWDVTAGGADVGDTRAARGV